MLDETNEARVPGAAAAGDQGRAGAGNQPQNALAPQPGPRPNPQDRNNPLGFLGRFFGVPNPARGHNNANGHHPGIFINYQVQYQFPRRQNDNNLHDEQLRPPPPFVGFPGPGGAWQPWPAQGVAQPQPTPNPTPAETPLTDGSPPHEAETSSASQNTSQSAEDLPSARDAARQAALRRFESQADGNRPEGSTSEPMPQPTPTSLPSTSTTSLRPPQLIPLFDFRDTAGSPRPSSATHAPAPDIDPGSSSQIAQDSTTTRSRLPRTLAEDQLELLDTLTRDSIEERLRILDGVSATLNECVDTLLKLRSALPPLPETITTNTSGPSSPSTSATSPGSRKDADNNLGKGKEKAPDISMSAGEEADLPAVQHEV